MKLLVILLLAIAVCHSAPADEAAVKAKRGLHLGIGYHHAPFVAHSYVAPAVVHHAPIISHAPIYAHAPIIAHAPVPVYASHHILPSYHSLHHYK